MDDIRQYNNDGVSVGGSTGDTGGFGGISGIGESEKPTSKPKRPWVRLSVILIIFGGLLILGGAATGSRGGRIYIDRGLRVEGFSSSSSSGGRTPLNTRENGYFQSSNTVHTLIINDARFRNVIIVPTSSPTLSITGLGNVDLNVTELNRVVTVSPSGVDGADVIGFRNATHISMIDFGGAFGISYRSYTPFIATERQPVTGQNFIEGERTRYLQYNIGGRVHLRENIHVYLPSSVMYLEVNTTSGVVRITNDGTLNSLNVRSSSGNIHVNGGDIVNGNLHSSSGTTRVNIDNVGSFASQTSSGNIHFNANNLENGTFLASSGVVRVDASVENNISVQTSSGNIHFNSDSVSTGYFRASSGVIRVNASFEERFSAQSTSGNIHFNGDRLANGRFGSSSGVIRVDAALEGDFTAAAGSGNIHVNDTSTRQTIGAYSLRATSGNIRFNTSRTVPQFSYTVNVGSGTIRTQGRRRDGRTYHGDGLSLGISAPPLVLIEATTTSGNVHLNFGR